MPTTQLIMHSVKMSYFKGLENSTWLPFDNQRRSATVKTLSSSKLSKQKCRAGMLGCSDDHFTFFVRVPFALFCSAGEYFKSNVVLFLKRQFQKSSFVFCPKNIKNFLYLSKPSNQRKQPSPFSFFLLWHWYFFKRFTL